MAQPAAAADSGGFAIVGAVAAEPQAVRRPLTSEVELPNSAHIARLLGPALIGITVTEWMNLDVFAAAIGPSFAAHVYLDGTLVFIAGLALVRAHNVWTRRWPVLITVVGWLGIVAGLGRMAAPVSAQQAGRSGFVVYGSLIGLLAIGILLTFKAYGKNDAGVGRPE